MLVEGVDKPCTPHIPVGPHRTFFAFAHWSCFAPYIAVVSCAPSIVYAIEIASCISAIIGESTYESYEWHSHFAEIGNMYRPVVFFNVDVHRVVATPWRPQ